MPEPTEVLGKSTEKTDSTNELGNLAGEVANSVTEQGDEQLTELNEELAQAQLSSLDKAESGGKVEQIVLGLVTFLLGKSELSEETKNTILNIVENIAQDPDENSADMEAPERKEKVGGLVEAVEDLVGSTAFRGKEVAGGRLACAQVISTALTNAGYMDKPSVSVTQTSKMLQESGWEKHQGPAQEGDVIIYNLTNGWTDKKGKKHPGYPHIGICVGPNLAVSNSSSKKTPRHHPIGENPEDKYWRNRGVNYYLRPPAV